MTVYRLPPLHDGQAEVARHGARFKVLICGRRWGKTRLGAAAALREAVAGGRVWWVAPSYAIAGIAWDLVRPLAVAMGAQVSESLRRLTMPGGGELAFKTADDPDKLRGQGLDLLILDEADFVARRVWEEVLRPALADRKGRALIISTPNREGGWVHELAQAGAAREGLELASWAFPSWTNPYLDDGEIAAARASLPSIVFRREFGAEFVSASGALIRREWIRQGEPVDLEGIRVSVGVDLAISTREGADYTAAVAMARDPGGRVYILDAARTRATFDGVLAFVRGFVERQRARVAVVAVEQVAYQAAVIQELLRTTELPVIGVRPDRDKVTRFLPLQARYEQGLILHAPGLEEAYTRELLGFPVGEHDDLIDAAVYAYRSLAGGALEMT